MNMDLLVVHRVSLLTSGFFFFFFGGLWWIYGFSGGFTNGVDGGFVGFCGGGHGVA